MKILKRLMLLFAVAMVGAWCFPALPAQAVEQTEIMLTTRLDAEEAVNVKYTYEITASDQNVPGATNEPETLVVDLSGVNPVDGTIEVNTALSFANTNYINMGIYRYTVREIATSNATYPISKQTYEIYVQNAQDTTSGQVVKQVYAQALNLDTDEKGELEFDHTKAATYILIENHTEGLLSDTGEYFRYRLEILGEVGTRYTILGQDVSITFDGRTIATETEYEVKSGDDNYIYIYLKDEQSLTVGLAADGTYEMPVGLQYRLIKDKVNRWYTTINGQHFSTEAEKMDYLSTMLDPVKNKIIVINEREFDVPMTAVFLNILPFVILILIAILGFYLIKKAKHENKKVRRRR